MRIRIASILLGEDVNVILEKIKASVIESESLKSRLESLLKKKQVLRDQISKDNNRHTSIINQIDALNNEIKQKRACCDLLNEIEKIENDISNKESIKSVRLSEIADKRNLLSVTTSKTNDLRRDISIANQDIEKNKSKIHSLLESFENEEVEEVDKEIIEYKEWLKSHLIDLSQIDQDTDDIIKLLNDRDTFIKIVKSLIEINNSLIQSVIRKEQLSTDIDNMKNNYHYLITTKDKIKKDIANTNEDITNKEKVLSDNNEANSEFQIINNKIEEIQEWLRNHSGELTRLQSEVNARINNIELKEHHIQKTQSSSIDWKPEPKKKTDSKPKRPYSDTPEGPRKMRNRIIKEIYDLETGETIIADEFFQKPMIELSKARDSFQECISKNIRRFVCPKCFEMIRISGRGDERGVPSIFTHKNDSVYCDRTTTGRSVEEIERIKYGRFGQSQRHKDLKEQLFNCLCDANSKALSVKNVEIEKRVKSTIPFFNYRQPDVLIEYQGRKIVFEIQLSTTFLSVIKERNTFYRLNGYYIIWVFNFDDNRRYVDLNNLAMKDVYFANKMNAFIFDDEAREWSKQRKQLVLKCNWLDTDTRWHYPNTEERFGGEPVTLDQLTFDTNTYKPYYYDAETPYYEAHPEIINKYTEEQKSIEDYIKGLEIKQQEENRKKQEALELMIEKDESVIPFTHNNKYGFKYGITIMQDPQFTSCDRKNDGSFIVGLSRKKGLVSKCGELFGNQLYINIHHLSGSVYLAEDKESFWLCNFTQRLVYRSPGDIVKCQSIGGRIDKVDIYHRDSQTPFSTFYVIDGLKILAEINKGYSFFDTQGKNVTDDAFSYIKFNMGEESILVQRTIDRKWNIIDYDGYALSKWMTDRPRIPIGNNKFIVYKDIRCGLQNSDGSEIIPISHVDIQTHPIYPYLIVKDYARDINYSGDYSFVLLGINGKQEGIPNQLKSPQKDMRFIGNKILMFGNKIVKLPDLTILAEGYDDAEEYDDINIITKKGGEKGMIKCDKTVIIPCKYRDIVEWGNGLFLCKKRRSNSINYSTNVSYYDSYDLIDCNGLRKGEDYSSVGPIIDNIAIVNKGMKEGKIDANGVLILEDIPITNELTAHKIFGYWEIVNKDNLIILNKSEEIDYIEALSPQRILIRHHRIVFNTYLFGLINEEGRKVIECHYKSISLWAPNIYRICEHTTRNYDPAFSLVDNDGKLLIGKYNFIGDLTNGEAKIKLGLIVGKIDEKAQPIYEREIPLADGCVKYSFMKRWGVRSSTGKEILPCKYYEITTYQGCYTVITEFIGGERAIHKTEIATANIIPVKGNKTGETLNSLVYEVGGKGFLVPKKKAENYWEKQIPDSADFIITNICEPQNPEFRGWRPKYHQNVIAKPYTPSKHNNNKHSYIQDGDVVKGKIMWMQYGNAIIKLGDGTTIFIHKSYLRNANIKKKYRGTVVEIRKIGYDEKYQKDKWEVLDVYNSGLE